jgi:hypothetical protein
MEVVFFIVSFSLMLFGASICIKKYLEPNGRFEDYYFIILVVSALCYYVAESLLTFTRQYSAGVVVFIQLQLTWIYWAITMYTFKKRYFRKLSIKRAWSLVLMLSIVIGFSLAGSLPLSHGFRPGIIVSNLPMFMKVQYSFSRMFTDSNETLRLFILSMGLFFSFPRRGFKDLLPITFASFIVIELMTLFNGLVDPPSLLVFRIEQGLEVFVQLTIIHEAVFHFGGASGRSYSRKK